MQPTDSPPASPGMSQGMDERKQITPQQPDFPHSLFPSQLTQQPRVVFSPATPSRRRLRDSDGTPSQPIRSPSNTASLRRGDVGRSNNFMIPSTPFSPSQNVVPSSQIASRHRPVVPGSHYQNPYQQDNNWGDHNNPEPEEDFNEDQHELMITDDTGFLGVGDAASAEVRIWGTEINVHSCANIFRHFLQNFRRRSTGTNGLHSSSLYLEQLAELKKRRRQEILAQMAATNTASNATPGGGGTGSATPTGPLILNINCSHFLQFPSTHHFYHQLIQYPQEIIPILDIVVNDEFKRLEVPPSSIEEEEAMATDGQLGLLLEELLQVRLYGLQERCRLRALNPENIEQLISVKGMVIRVSSIIPDLKQAFFRCSICNHTLQIGIERGRIDEPNACPQCQTLASLEIIHNRCIFTDKQMIRLQETPDEIPEGETPQTITLFAFDDLVDTVRPGDRLEVTGIFRAIPRRTNPRLRTVKSVFKTYLDVIHFRRAGFAHEEAAAAKALAGITDTATSHNNTLQESTTLAADQQTSQLPVFTPQRIQEFVQFSQSPQVEERLVKSFAPSIWGMDDVKKGLLCLLFGGTVHHKNTTTTTTSEEEELVDENETHHRGDINILLCGDPGTSKSQLLSYVHKLTPRGIYTSGKGSSAVGLTASVVRDPETRDMVLESGALVLSDNGICCIDEFDKMTDQTRAILHEAMEQQTVSITKAGIIATLNARTSILASANPVQSRYNPHLSVVDNIKLPPTLLSRFDLIYLILDKPNQETDRRLAQHLVSLYLVEDEEEEEKEGEDSSPLREGRRHRPRLEGLESSRGEYKHSNEEESELVQPVDQQFLKEYLLYARYHVFPEITAEAEDLLVHNYVTMRSLGSGGGGSSGGSSNNNRGMKIITATPRQLESLIRLSQAIAKMHLSPTVDRLHVEEATRLMKVATQTAATDPRTGRIDMDLISTGRTAINRELVNQLCEAIIAEILSVCQVGDRLTLSQVRQRIQSQQQSAYSRYGSSNSSSIIGSLTITDMEDAARKLESEGVIQFIDRSQTMVIRSIPARFGRGSGGGEFEDEEGMLGGGGEPMEEDDD